MANPGENWTQIEVEAVVDDYLTMLAAELSGRPYNKAEHNRFLKARTGRSHGSIERKHQNISAVLRDLDQPFIDGYKPLGHGQGLLEEVVLKQLAVDRRGVLAAAEALITAPVPVAIPSISLADIQVAPPDVAARDSIAREAAPRRRRIARIRNYVELDAQNRALGRAGEEFVVDVEQRRLWDDGRKDLAKLIEHVAVTQGDGLGYDVRSFELNGTPRLIEVKTTSFGIRTPFFVSKAELDASFELASEFQLYRIFTFRKSPRFFALRGALRDSCELEASHFVARVGRNPPW